MKDLAAATEGRAKEAPFVPGTPKLDANRRCALARSPNGAPEAIVSAYGFPAALLVGLMQAGFAISTVYRVRT